MKTLRAMFINLYFLSTFFALTPALSFSEKDNTHVFMKEDIMALAMDKRSKSTVYVGSSNSVYVTLDGGTNWRKIFAMNTPNKKINEIYCDPHEQNVIYAAAQDGLYQSKDQGDAWKRIFQGRSDLENDCLSIVKVGEILFLGTKEGLFKSDNQGKKWRKAFNQLSESVITSLVVDPHAEGDFYLVCEKGLFRIENKGRDLKRMYIVYGSEIPSEDFSDYDGDVSNKVLSINSIALSLRDRHQLYIATSKGIYVTENDGRRWEKIPQSGLSLGVRALLLTRSDKLIAATKKGVFCYHSNRWQNISSALRYQDFNELMNGSEGAIWLAGKGGVYKIYPERHEQNNAMSIVGRDFEKIDIKHLFDGEPEISDVQRAAIEYAEVNMNKIKRWRKQARLKALFPSVSVGYDKSIYGSSSGSVAVGPRDWNVDLSWDVADLVWSSDQTSIDSRSRLTVQLRQDVLDQVTHLFYERKRLTIEMLSSPPQSKREHYLKELELHEITAAIDGLTDGYFSQFKDDHQS